VTSTTLTDEQLDHLADALADRIADRLADHLALAPSSAAQLVDAAELARILGVARRVVYEHADEWGAARIGGGSKPRLRFDPETARAAIARSGSESSQTENANGDGPSAPPARRTSGRRVAGLPKPGSVLDLRPAPKGRRRGRSQER
jgi:hypothetical protein